MEFDLASDLSSNVHPCHLKGNTTVLADKRTSKMAIYSIPLKWYALCRGDVITRVWRFCPKTCWSWDIILFMISIMSISHSHLKKAVAVDENPSHAIELQAPHLVSNIPNKGTTELRTEWFCQTTWQSFKEALSCSHTIVKISAGMLMKTMMAVMMMTRTTSSHMDPLP